MSLDHQGVPGGRWVGATTQVYIFALEDLHGMHNLVHNLFESIFNHNNYIQRSAKHMAEILKPLIHTIIRSFVMADSHKSISIKSSITKA